MSEDRYICKRCRSEYPGSFVARVGRCRQCGGNVFEQVLPEDAPICDFCSYPEAAYEYPCRDFSQQFTGSPRMHWRSRDNWFACEACHLLIQRQDRAGLSLRSATRYIERHPDQQIGPLDDLVFEIRKTHDNFWANREGAPKRLETA